MRAWIGRAKVTHGRKAVPTVISRCAHLLCTSAGVEGLQKGLWSGPPNSLQVNICNLKLPDNNNGVSALMLQQSEVGWENGRAVAQNWLRN